MQVFKKKKTKRDPEERRASGKRLLSGGYALAITAIALAAIVILNLIIGAIPSKFTTFDVSKQKLYSIGDTTKEVLNQLKEDVTLNFLTAGGQEDSTIEKLLATYDGYSKRVHVKKVDIVSDPAFFKAYAKEAPSVNSVIVTAKDKSKVLDANVLYQQSMNGYSYSASAFDGEGQITSAISYVTGGESGTVYYTTGHKELPLASGMTDVINKSNLGTKELNLISQEIPEDCSALLIFAPSSDFTEDEAKKVSYYLDNGGHAMIVSLSNELTKSGATPNFDSILSHYGIQRKGGVVLEGDQSKFVQAPYLMVPSVNTASAVTTDLGNQNILYAMPEALSIDDHEESSYTRTALLNSSDKAYIKTDLEHADTIEKKDGDETGSFPLAVQVESTASKDSDGDPDVKGAEAKKKEEASKGATKLLYFTTPAVFSADTLSSLIQVTTSLPEGNETLFSDSLTYLTDREVSVSVDAKSLSTPMLSSGEMSEAFSSLAGNIVMFLIPGVFLILGIVIWVRRRAR
jgi:ABC-2 type transport system permease protein